MDKTGKPALSARDVKLAQALRANLRRRKARIAPAPKTPPPDQPA